MPKYYCFFIFLFLWFSSSAVIPNTYLKDSVLKFRNVSADASLDGVTTSMRGYGLGLAGFKVGIKWMNKFKAGMAYRFTTSNITQNTLFGDSIYRTKFRYTSFSFYGEYNFLKNEKFSVSAGLKPGIGWTSDVIHAKEPNMGAVKLNSYTFGIVEPYISGGYNIIPWLGIAGGLGYRQGIFSPTWVSSWTVNFGISVSVVQIFKGVDWKNGKFSTSRKKVNPAYKSKR